MLEQLTDPQVFTLAWLLCGAAYTLVAAIDGNSEKVSDRR